ncbi:hypothetical protein E4659_07470 [Dickeya dianthicola]|uniref:hypothetical protein n=2 Tax=Dickeya dianthicola TaxID=204039 RepID=UPI00118733B9|nr:hypothetical protein [Dickeya dianthicola]MBI0437160.1 hypothetical protein [Dickeya dianthicola]MBI0447733.1 hypothetical protein [Dickeya dianthicola]MBI0452350.1 hypothetical protein [Dickeya dianthicola]MBI0456448.1 hypothetical protein [Dickeya dianthicola]MBI0461138.1 hypothetical protein [Dickeya dianthicola]
MRFDLEKGNGASMGRLMAIRFVGLRGYIVVAMGKIAAVGKIRRRVGQGECRRLCQRSKRQYRV